MSSAIVFDRAQALERLGGDEELLSTVSSLFVEESVAYRKALADALASGDSLALRREAHTVKSLFATFSFDTGRELAVRLEQLAGSGQLDRHDGAAALTAEVIAAIETLAAALRR